MPRIGTEYSRQYSRPEDKQREAEAAKRVELLNQVAGQQRDTEERDLMAAANTAFDEHLAVVGGTPLNAAPMDAAIAGVKARAAANVETASLSKEELQARATATALADVLEQRGVVPATDTSPDVDDLIAADPDETFIDEAGDIWSLDANGSWTRQDDEAEEEPEDQWPSYTSTGNEGFLDLTGSDDKEEYDDAAA
jgi:hypothetical protein